MRKCVICNTLILDHQVCVTVPVDTKQVKTVRVCNSCDIRARDDYHSVIQTLVARLKGHLTGGN